MLKVFLRIERLTNFLICRLTQPHNLQRVLKDLENLTASVALSIKKRLCRPAITLPAQ